MLHRNFGEFNCSFIAMTLTFELDHLSGFDATSSLMCIEIPANEHSAVYN